MPANLENSAVVTGLEKVFILIPNKGNAKKCSNYCMMALISHASKVMLKILQARLQKYVNCELPDVQAIFRKARGTRNQIANICWIIEKAKRFQKKICFIDYAKVFDYADHNKLWKILQEMGILDHLTCLLRNLYTGSVQFSPSVVSDSLQPYGGCKASLSITNSRFTHTHVHRVGDAIQPSHPLLSLSPPAFNLSQHHGLSNESALRIRWPKYWSFSFSASVLPWTPRTDLL